ncbi:MAG: hypothetical protein KIT84_23080 [Labilithrix sp.]|nr:hypothetical protein [Labilithrix sp.]MCW5813930.1 hypothetical protein [Labilithrix sp.]
MKRRLLCVLAGVLVFVLAACGGDRKDARSPESAGASSPAPAETDDDSRPDSATAAPEPPPPPPSPAPTTPEAEAVGDVLRAYTSLEASTEQLRLAGSDCLAACRALASMDRAAGHLCGMVHEEGRCTQAKETVYSARARVKKTCGSCPDTSVDPKDPVPFKR